MNEKSTLYTEGVRWRINTKNSLYFPNNGDDCAVILLKEFINHSNRTIKIFSENLEKSIYEQLRTPLLDALQRDVHIQFLFENEEIETNSLIKSFIQMARINHYFQLEIRCVANKNKVAHFSIFDCRMFRLELDKSSKESMACAYASSYDAIKMISTMDDVYNILWEESNKIIL